LKANSYELFIPRGAVHSVRNVNRGPMRWLFGYDRPEPQARLQGARP
jgi:oxalate decarboxylase/phosphoglucose isomerase-like protein (cupin superfamily)